MLRTHTCGQLRKSDVGTEVTLCGWVESKRDHGGAVFIDLRDRYGLTQVVIGPPEADADRIGEAGRVPAESVILIRGKVSDRLEGKANEKLDTGAIEVRCDHFEVLNICQTPPFTPGQSDLPGEDLRLKYRFLDLRCAEMQRAMVTRSKIVKTMRDYFAEHDFIDVETPILGRSTPEVLAIIWFPAVCIRRSFMHAPITAAVQTNSDGRRLRSLRSSRQMFS